MSSIIKKINNPIIVLDLGSKRIKGLLLTLDGSSIIESRNASYLREGVIDSKDYLLKATNILKTLLDRAYSDKILLGITGQRASIVGWNRNLDYITPIYTWRDEGAYKIYEEMTKKEDLGILEMFLQPGTGILRVKNVLNLHGDLDYVGGVESLIIYHIFKEFITDYSFAYAYGIIEPFTLSILDDILSLLDIDREILPRFISYKDLPIKSKYSNVELVLSSVISDQSAALAGEGCFEKGCGKITMGTGIFIDYYTDTDPIGDPSMGVNPMVAWIIDDEPRYMAEYFIYHGGDVLDSIRNLGIDIYELGIEDFDFDLIPLYIPSYTFLTTETRKRFSGAIFNGLKPHTRLKHMVQAIIASVCFLIGRGLRNIRGLDIEGDLYVSGGWSNCRLLLQIVSHFIDSKLIVRSRRSYSTMYGVIPFILSKNPQEWKSIIDYLRPIEETYVPLRDEKADGFISRLEKLYERIIA